MVEGRANFSSKGSLKGNMPLLWQRLFWVIPSAVRFIFVSAAIVETLPLASLK